MEAEKKTNPINFSVYQNPLLSAALTARSLRPSKSTIFFVFTICISSASALFSIASRGDGFMEYLHRINVPKGTSYLIWKVSQIVVAFVFIGSISGLLKVVSLQKTRDGVHLSYPSSGTKEPSHLTDRQQALIGLKKPISNENVDKDSLFSTGSRQKPPKSRLSSPSTVLFPLHNSASKSSNSSSQIGLEKHSSSGGKPNSLTHSSVSPASTSPLYLVNLNPRQPSSVQSSPALDKPISTPWSKQRLKEIPTEAVLEEFLADVREKIMESAVTPSQSLMTPPPTLHGVGVMTPTSAATSATARSTPLRPVRMSPSSQKYTTPPKKGEGDLPMSMSMEQVIEAFESLGIYPHIEQWRDRLRQWFSAVLLNPLMEKIEMSHIQVMQAAAKLGICITVSQVGSDSLNAGTPVTVSPIEGIKGWQPTFVLDEDGLLHQLRATLVQVRDGNPSAQISFSSQQQPQNPMIPIIQECLDAITEHQRLHALMKGEWVKGLLPHSSVRADYSVQRIKAELAEGTCLKNYEYLGNGEVYDKVNNRWTLELPTDSHLLLYLFCAYLEHPKWMLHVEPTSYASTQSSKNPLFLGILPPKDRFPEKYVAVLSSTPPVLHPGACILAVGKPSPPVFALYWEKKLQFSLQGRTALWDVLLLLCHRIKVGYGGIVRGMPLSSLAFNIHPIIEMEIED
ncbi:transmembrane protein 209 isoform X1 [Amborella trichopoda]|uniref:transmembrane protein 209 isoform X1 n=2 Tax=Amborella trichopoda TaxID=13333 RepID=UPI0009BCCC2E|nr:transmembrane protein 209 isoform X1 [Amborella trichopoda]|eukprot:XP_020526683.1 transmembrane protein 209 isoform X1 [Amborella trichopoda]